MKEVSRETIEKMEKYVSRVDMKETYLYRYYLRLSHGYALYDAILEDPIKAMNLCFEYGFAKGVQAERNRLKNINKRVLHK